MNVEEIVKKYLKENGYDGLWNENGECSCELDDLFPCNGFYGHCQPGYKVLGCLLECGQGCKFHIMAEKPAQGTLPLTFEKEEESEYRCERCGKFFDSKIFSHSRFEIGRWGQPVGVECGPIIRVIR